MIDINGSTLEGGGQVIRMAMGLSALLRKPIRIKNIRGGRSKPGLRAQHVCGLQLVQRLAGGQLQGATLGSTQLVYVPDDCSTQQIPSDGSTQVFEVNIGTAGATTLLAQVALPVALFRHAPCTLELTGGTDVDFAPGADYYKSVFLKNLSNGFGIKSVQCDVLRRGYFPKGNGILRLNIEPIHGPLDPMSIVDQGQLLGIGVYASRAGRVPEHVSSSMASGACHVLSRRYSKNTISVDTRYFDHHSAFGNGTSLLVKADFMALKAAEDDSKTPVECAFAAGQPGQPKNPPEQLGTELAQEVLDDLEAKVCFDQHAQDQIIIFMALAHGQSRVLTRPLTLHTKTAIWISELMTHAKFNVLELNKDQTIIECQGIGYTRKMTQMMQKT